MFRLARRDFIAALVALPLPAAAQTADRLMVFAAASLTNTLEEIGRNYGRARGKRVVFSFAASMTLAKQIEAGVFQPLDRSQLLVRCQRHAIVTATEMPDPPRWPATHSNDWISGGGRYLS